LGKNLVIAAFLIAFTYALWIYFNREDKSLKQSSLVGHGNGPQLDLAGISITRYKSAKLDVAITSEHGQLLDSEHLELSDGVKLDRVVEGKVEKIRANSAIAVFSSTSSSRKGPDGELVSAKLRGDVRVDFGNYTLLTDSAEYFADEDKIVGDEVVTVRGENRWFKGTDGFSANLDSEEVEIFGKVNGEARVQ
jgi:hypothetical protein